MDYYKILGIERGASDEEIKRAYRKLASIHHPDKGGDTQKFQEIQQAYSVLGDAAQRQQYDNPRKPQGMGPMGQGFDFDTIFHILVLYQNNSDTSYHYHLLLHSCVIDLVFLLHYNLSYFCCTIFGN